MGREQSALSWLSRYDALLREREEESRREQVVREILKAKATEDVLPPSFQVARAEDPLHRRKRPVRETFVPIFLPKETAFVRPAPVAAPAPVVEAAPAVEAAAPAAAEPAEVEVEAEVEDRVQRESAIVPKLAAEAEAPLEAQAEVEVDVELEAPADEPAVDEDEVQSALSFVGRSDEALDEPEPLAELSAAAVGAWSSIPPPPAHHVDDAATDPMAVPPAFTRPPPVITVFVGPNGQTAPLDETTEPMDMGFAEQSVPIELSPLGMSPNAVSPVVLSAVAMSAAAAEPAPSGPMLLSPPPAPRLVELSPPPMDRFLHGLTPPSMPSRLDAPPAPVPAPTTAGSSIPLPTFELKNPWADDRPRTVATPAKPTFGERLEPWKPAMRTLVLAFLAASIGIAVRSALTLREPAPAPPAAVLPAAPVAAPVAAPTVAPGAPVAQAPVAAAAAVVAPAADGLAAKVTGNLDVVAAPGAPIVVDGIERGAGPRLTIPLGTGYHMVRIGSSVTQLVQVRAKQTVTLDVTPK